MMSSALLHGPRSMYAIRVLRSHGMPESALQQVLRAVVVSKLTYAVPAWWGFTRSVSELMVFSAERTNLDSGHLTLLHSRLSVYQLTTNFSPKLLHTLNIYYTHFCHHCQPPVNPTALDAAHTHINSLDIQPISRTVTSLPECCTKTPTEHYLSFLLCCVCIYMN